VKVLDLAEFDLHLDLVPVNGLREQLDMNALLMGDQKSILVDSYFWKNTKFISDSFYDADEPRADLADGRHSAKPRPIPLN